LKNLTRVKKTQIFNKNPRTPDETEKNRYNEKNSSGSTDSNQRWYRTEVCMDWILDFSSPDSGCILQDPDSGFLKISYNKRLRKITKMYLPI